MREDAEQYIECVKNIPDLVADIFKFGLYHMEDVKEGVSPCYFHIHGKGEDCHRATLGN
jgi:hypothetical protein